MTIYSAHLNYAAVLFSEYTEGYISGNLLEPVQEPSRPLKDSFMLLPEPPKLFWGADMLHMGLLSFFILV